MGKWRPGLAVAAIAAFAASCAQQAASPSAAPSSAPGASANRDGCDIDAAKLCQQVAVAPITSASTGLTLDPREREEAAPRTAWETAQTRTPGGTIIEVSCGINAQQSAVVSAQALKGAPLTDADVIYLRAQGLCRN